MIIKSTIKIAKVNPYANHEICNLVTGKHHIAWSEEIDSEIPYSGKKQKTQLLEAPYLRTFSINQLQEAGDPKSIKQEYLSLGKKGCDLAQKCFPNLIDRPIDGINLLIASTQAYDAWTSSSESYAIDGAIATGKAMVQAFDVLEPFFPVLQQYETHKQLAHLLLIMADSVYIVKKDPALLLNSQQITR